MHPNLKKFLDILQMVGPGILALTVPGAQVFIPIIIAAIGEAQQIKGATGPQKKAHVMAIVTSAVTIANANGRELIDKPVLLATVGSGIDAVVGVVGLVEGRKKVVDAVPAEKPAA